MMPATSIPHLVASDEAPAAVMEDPPLIEPISVDLRITSVKHDFRLSEDPNFSAQLEAVAGHCVGKFCVITRETLIVQYAHYAGKCRVSRNGYVSCQGQLSMEEADEIAQKVLWDFKNTARQAVGMFTRRFTWILMAGELPFQVNLNRLKRANPDVQYAAEIAPAATIKFEDLKVSINLFRSGKFLMQSMGDCDPVNYEMTCTTSAIERLVYFVQEFILAGTMKSALLAASLEPLIESFPKKKFTAPRRSERIRDGPVEDDADAYARSEDDLSTLTLPERRLHQFFMEYAGVHGSRQLSRTLKAIHSSNSSSPESWAKVAQMFIVQTTGPSDSDPAVPRLRTVTSGISDSSKNQKRDGKGRPKQNGQGTAEPKRSLKKKPKGSASDPDLANYSAEEVAAAKAVRTEILTRKDYLVRILSRIEQWR